MPEDAAVIAKRLIDPELVPLRDSMPPITLTREVLPTLRPAIIEMLATAGPRHPGTEVDEHVVQAEGAPGVRVLHYRPANAQGVLPAILHIHGGGYVMGAPEMNDVDNSRLASELGCQVFSVDYRLSPETAHPGPVEDCYAVLQWLHASSDALGIDPARIGVKGESAGGGLAAALVLLARDRRGPPVAFQHLIYPMLDDRTCTKGDLPSFAGSIGWTPELNRFGWSSLLGHEPGGADVSPYAASARAGDLSGLPPAYISVGTLDLFLEEDLDYAARLYRAAVPVELHVWPGAQHGFERAVTARVSKAATQASQAALRRALHG